MSARTRSMTVALMGSALVALAASQAFALTVEITRPTCDPLIVVEDYELEFEAVAWDENQEDVTDQVTWEWDFDDNTTSDENPAEHAFENPANYTVTVTGTLSAQQAQDTRQVEVQQADPNAEGWVFKVYYPGDPPQDAGGTVCHVPLVAARHEDPLPFDLKRVDFYYNDPNHEGEPTAFDDDPVKEEGVTYWQWDTEWETWGHNETGNWSAIVRGENAMEGEFVIANLGPIVKDVLNVVIKGTTGIIKFDPDSEDPALKNPKIEWEITHLDPTPWGVPEFAVAIEICDLVGEPVHKDTATQGGTGAGEYTWDGWGSELPPEPPEGDQTASKGTYTYKVTAQCVGGAGGGEEDTDKSDQLAVSVDKFYYFWKDVQAGKLKGIVKYTLNRAAAEGTVKIEFFDPDLDKLGELADQAHEAGTHWSDVYELTGVEFDGNDNPVGPISCVLYAQENDQDGNLNRDRQPKPALQKGSANLQLLQVGVQAEGATLIPAQDGVGGDETMLHFVTPKGGAEDKVTLTATITPDGEALKPLIDWEGATQDPEDPLKATVPKNAAAKHVVKIKLDGKVIKEFRVWVVWCTENSGGGNGLDVQVGQQRTDITLDPARWFDFAIEPSTIIDDANRPNLSGNKTTDPPSVPAGEGDCWHRGADLGGGADMQWDESRRIRIKLVNPDGINFDKPDYYLDGLCWWKTWASWPSNPVAGNDDKSTIDEDNDPYDPAFHGKLRGSDQPHDYIMHADGSAGDTAELRLHFREFARLELGGTWYVISDDFPWRIHYKFKKDANGVWQDDGSSTAADNNGW